MQSIRQIERLNQAELEKCVPPNASWHTDYRDTAYIHIGGLPFELSEGDVLTIFSQYGNPVHLNLVRDKETGKSRGFAFLKYEDQRSCDLAVDNMSGAGVMGRVLSVDHCRYTLKEGEIEGEGLREDDGDGDETDRDDGGASRKRRRKSESESEEERPLLREEVELAKLLREHDDDDPMKAYMVKEKKAEVEEALKALTVSKKSSKRRDGEKSRERRHRHHRSRRDRSVDEDDGRKDRHRARREDDESRGKRSHRSRKEEDEEEADARSRKRRSERRSYSRDGGYRNGHVRSKSPDSDQGRRRHHLDSKRDRSVGERHRPEDSEEEYRRRRD